MAKPKRTKPGARLFVTTDAAHEARLERIAVKAGRETGRAVPATELHRRGFPALLAALESCTECRAGKCTGEHARAGQPSAPADVEPFEPVAVDVRCVDELSVCSVTIAPPPPSGSPPVARIEVTKTVALDGQGQADLFASKTSVVVLAPSPPEPKRRSVARSYPDGFVLTNEMRAYAVKRGIASDCVADMFEHFSTHHRAKGSRFVDWTLAFYTWVRNDKRFGGTNQTRNGPTSTQDEPLPEEWK